ncbi:D-tyrosyl-tRNA(Tyr) deacylase [Mariprofundus ferrinatatus]|uniref:D-tyrosyl-tRNA(Tyr) deacylase n=2 Tax=Mariprofundus ferrinatatus TaxID=1921087 RepID=A0A2K8L2S5_9PROT|nr:D-tyrosyl-tRNA(Tyr) deacylase [Mariprofundus ferrinatatus]
MLVTDNTKAKKIGRGVVALVGVEKTDNQTSVRRMAERLTGYRIFPDTDGRMNLSLHDIGGDILLVPNFTVAADTKKGTRAGFSTAAEPSEGERLFLELAELLSGRFPSLQTGHFGADMQITLTNDGPVTFILDS